MTGFSLFFLLFMLYLDFACCYRRYYPPDTIFGDGQADDTFAIQSILDNTKDGGIVDFSKMGMCGKFSVSKTLILPNIQNAIFNNGHFIFKPRVDYVFSYPWGQQDYCDIKILE